MISAPIARWPSIAALVADPELGAVGELARLADVVEQRRRHQQVGVEPRVELTELADERADRDRVLEQAAEVGVMAGAGAGRAAQLGRDGLGVVTDRLDDALAAPGRGSRRRGARRSPRAPRPTGRRRAGTRPGSKEPGSIRCSAVTSAWSSPRKRSTLPRTSIASPRSKRAPSCVGLAEDPGPDRAGPVAQLERQVGAAVLRLLAILAGDREAPRSGLPGCREATPSGAARDGVRGGRGFHPAIIASAADGPAARG